MKAHKTKDGWSLISQPDGESVVISEGQEAQLDAALKLIELEAGSFDEECCQDYDLRIRGIVVTDDSIKYDGGILNWRCPPEAEIYRFGAYAS